MFGWIAGEEIAWTVTDNSPLTGIPPPLRLARMGRAADCEEPLR